MNRRTAGAVMTVAGLVLTGAGGVMLVTGEDSTGDAAPVLASTTTAVPAPSTTTTSASPPAAPTTTTTTAAPGETPQTFFSLFAAAVRNGDEAFLVDRLDAAVLDRYTVDACRTTLGRLQIADFDVKVLDVGAAREFDFALDGLRRAIPDTIPVRIERTEGGRTSTSESNVRSVGGLLRWFTDCGTPKERAR